MIEAVGGSSGGGSRSKSARLLSDLITGRASVRAFTDRDIASHDLESLLDLACRAPSPSNTQPWNVFLVRREAMGEIERLIDRERAVAKRTRVVPEPYRSRKAQWERQLSGLVGNEATADRSASVPSDRGELFFGAPLALLVTVDRRLGNGAHAAAGMFVQNLLLAAESYGIGSCVQFVFAGQEDRLGGLLDLGEDNMIVCGVALGYPDPAKPENWLAPVRAASEEWMHVINPRRTGDRTGTTAAGRGASSRTCSSFTAVPRRIVRALVSGAPIAPRLVPRRATPRLA